MSDMLRRKVGGVKEDRMAPRQGVNPKKRLPANFAVKLQRSGKAWERRTV